METDHAARRDGQHLSRDHVIPAADHHQVRPGVTQGGDVAVHRPFESGSSTFVKVGQAVNASGGTPTPPKGESVVKIAGVHVGCAECEKVIADLFPDGKVTFTGKGPQRDVQVVTKDLKSWDVTWRLSQAGFGGKVQN